MPNASYTPLSSTWSALADPRRRELLSLPQERPRVVGELVQLLGLSQPATAPIIGH